MTQSSGFYLPMEVTHLGSLVLRRCLDAETSLFGGTAVGNEEPGGPAGSH